MIALGLIFALTAAVPQLSSSVDSQTTMQQPANGVYERNKKRRSASTRLRGEFARRPTPAPSYLKLRVSC